MSQTSGDLRETLAALLQPLRADPHRPRLVCHLADGARTELSGASLVNWTAKVAGLLVDELGAATGDVVSIRLAAGWQSAPIVLGSLWAGMTIIDDDDPDAIAAFVPPGSDAKAEEVFVVSGHPLGAPATDIAAHQRDFTTAVLPQADRLGAPAEIRADATAVTSVDGTTTTVADLVRSARRAGDELAGAGASVDAAASSPRPVLVSATAWTLPDGLVRTLLAALAADGTLVQCDPGLPAERVAAIAAAERGTATVGVDVRGLPRLG